MLYFRGSIPESYNTYMTVGYFSSSALPVAQLWHEVTTTNLLRYKKASALPSSHILILSYSSNACTDTIHWQ